MAPKRKSQDETSGGRTKQTQLNFGARPASASGGAAAEAGAPGPSQPAAMQMAEVLPVLSAEDVHSLETKAEEYKAAWAERCMQLGEANRGLPLKDHHEADLDAAGLSFLEACRSAFQQACRRGAVLPRGILEVLVLVLRNDAVHRHPHVSRQAYSLLQGYLRQFPAVALQRDAGAGARPCAVTSMQKLPQYQGAGSHESSKLVENFWWGLESNRASFSQRHLLVSDMETAGRLYKADVASLAADPQDKRSLERFSHPFALLLHLFKAAAESENLNRDGDLLLLRHLLAVLGQDLRCRLTVFKAYEDAAEDDSTQRQRIQLLQDSLLWRACVDSCVRNPERQELTGLLVRLVCGAPLAAPPTTPRGRESSVQLEEEALQMVEQDKAMASAAETAMLTRQQLAATAAQFLRMQLELFGSMESAGGFHAVGRSRSVATNLRVLLDKMLLQHFWGKDAVCRSDDLSRAFLRALPPRDRLRFLGMLVADTFVKSFKEVADLATKVRFPALKEAAEVLEDGGMAARFWDVDMLQVVQCISYGLTQDVTRTYKSYHNINCLSVLVSGLALTLHALAATGSDLLHAAAAGGGEDVQPQLGCSVAELSAELRTALKCIAERGCDPREANKLAANSRLELVHAQMALAALATS